MQRGDVADGRQLRLDARARSEILPVVCADARELRNRADDVVPRGGAVAGARLEHDERPTLEPLAGADDVKRHAVGLERPIDRRGARARDRRRDCDHGDHVVTSFTVMLYLNASASTLSSRPFAVSPCGYMK